VDIASVTPTGAGGRITKADVEAAARPEATLPKKPPAAEVPLTGLRRIIAERMSTSHQTTARVTLTTEVDATSLVEMRNRLKASVTDEWGFTPAYNDLLGVIVAQALSEFPYMNARLSEDGQSIRQLPHVHLGIAVDTERGLLVPVVRDAHQKRLRAFGAEFRTLLQRAQAGKSLPDDLTGGTFTITNLGAYGIDAFTPIINLPETAILGVGRIRPKPAVHDGEIAARQMGTLSLTFDHRLVDGAPAARFLQRVSSLVQNPYLLLE
jgi:pyruvate dehydrogenase E2 component (dihydrolipoamide acetyltransferase)